MSPFVSLAATAVLLSGQAEQFVSFQSNPQRKIVATRTADTDSDYLLQGEYLGQVQAVDGRAVDFGLQVVALGDGQFSARGYQGGLPGNGWDLETVIAWEGTKQGNLLVFDGERGRVVLEGGGGMIIDSSGQAVGQVTKIRRVSTMEGAEPPPEATVLFDGTNTDAFEQGKLTEEQWLDVGALTKTLVQDFRLHLEFRLPYMPYARSQGRGNSGVYIQRRYEVQILDSFGLEPVFNGCAALYRQQVPDLNMSFPPLAWQTYDIFFTAARWDEEGNKADDAQITVYHNGIAVHYDRVIPTKTGAGKQEAPTPGPILLQNHGNPVRFRNVWLVVDSLPESADADEQQGETRSVLSQDTNTRQAEPAEPAETTPLDGGAYADPSSTTMAADEYGIPYDAVDEGHQAAQCPHCAGTCESPWSANALMSGCANCAGYGGYGGPIFGGPGYSRLGHSVYGYGGYGYGGYGYSGPIFGGPGYSRLGHSGYGYGGYGYGYGGPIFGGPGYSRLGNSVYGNSVYGNSGYGYDDAVIWRGRHP